MFVEQVPIPKASTERQRPLIALVDSILALTKADSYPNDTAAQEKVRVYEQEIDRLVYELYGLTQEEIAVVEGV